MFDTQQIALVRSSAYPFLDMQNVLIAVLEVLLDVLLVAVEERGLRSLAFLLRGGPATDLNVGRNMIGSSISIGGL